MTSAFEQAVNDRRRPVGTCACFPKSKTGSSWLMRSILLAALAFFILVGQATSQERTDQERRSVRTWLDPDLGQALIEGAGTPQHLWIRGASKKVVRFDRETGERSIAAENVIDILADGPRLWALIALNENQSVVRDLRRPDVAERRIYSGGSPVALFATDAGPGVLTTTQALLPTTTGWSRRLIAGSLDQHARVSALTGDALFVGYNKGEWGGGLRRVDTSTGAISFVREPGGDPCQGRLNPDCAPIVGVISDPEREGCVLVGASLAHLSGRYGEVLRVCGYVITPVFADPLPVIPNSLEFRAGRTWPFDSLVGVKEGWVAVGQDRFARSANGVVAMHDTPSLRAWAGLQISDEIDDVIFVEAACCWGSETSIRYRVIAIPIGD